MERQPWKEGDAIRPAEPFPPPPPITDMDLGDQPTIKLRLRSGEIKELLADSLMLELLQAGVGTEPNPREDTVEKVCAVVSGLVGEDIGPGSAVAIMAKCTKVMKEYREKMHAVPRQDLYEMEPPPPSMKPPDTHRVHDLRGEERKPMYPSLDECWRTFDRQVEEHLDDRSKECDRRESSRCLVCKVQIVKGRGRCDDCLRLQHEAELLREEWERNREVYKALIEEDGRIFEGFRMAMLTLAVFSAFLFVLIEGLMNG